MNYMGARMVLRKLPSCVQIVGNLRWHDRSDMWSFDFRLLDYDKPSRLHENSCSLILVLSSAFSSRRSCRLGQWRRSVQFLRLVSGLSLSHVARRMPESWRLGCSRTDSWEPCCCCARKSSSSGVAYRFRFSGLHIHARECSVLLASEK